MTSRASVDQRRPRRSPGVLAATVDDDLVLWNPTNRTSHVLNPTAREVWQHLDGRQSVAELIDELTAAFAVDRSVVRDDTMRLLRELDERELVDSDAIVPPPPPAWPEAIPRPSTHQATHDRAVDRHRWQTVTGTHAAFDFTFALHDETSLTERALAPALAPLSVDGPPDHRYTIRATGDDRVRLAIDGRVLRVNTPAGIARYLIWHVNRLAVASVPDQLVLHAGCVQLDGRTVLLPAAMNSGKSTLTAALVQRGWDYLTDEALAVDPASGQLHPYPRAITIDRGSWAVLAELEPSDPTLASGELLGSWHVSPTAIRPASVGRPSPVELLVFPRYDGDRPTALAPITPVEALTTLLAQTFDFGGAGQRGLDHLRVLARLPAYRLSVNDLDQADAALRSLTAATSAISELR